MYCVFKFAGKLKLHELVSFPGHRPSVKMARKPYIHPTACVQLHLQYTRHCLSSNSMFMIMSKYLEYAVDFVCDKLRHKSRE